MSSPKSPRFMTLDEAQKMLPLVRSIVRDIVDQYDQYRQRIPASRGTTGTGRRSDPSPSATSRGLAQEVTEAIKAEIDGAVAELNALGVELRDYESGLVDFPGKLGDDLVYFCWKPGEERISHWQPLDSGCDARQPLEETPATNGGRSATV